MRKLLFAGAAVAAIAFTPVAASAQVGTVSGTVAGAAIGSVAGPVGAVVGGVAGFVVGSDIDRTHGRRFGTVSPCWRDSRGYRHCN